MMMGTQLLKDKVAVVTGGGRGIGRAIAMSLAEEGSKVVVNAFSPDAGSADKTVKDILDKGGRAVAWYGDIAEFEVAEKLIQTAVDNFGGMHILVNNAGMSGSCLPWDMSEQEWDRMIKVHLYGTFNCTRHACHKMMEQRWGRIVNCTSGSWLSRAGACHYAAAKAGIVGFTRAIAMDLEEYGVTCNAYHPYAKTDLMGPQTIYTVEQRYKQGKINKEEYEWQRNPPSPDSVGPFVAYLASEQAAGVNGKVFYVSGGKVALYTEPVRKKTIFKEEGYWSPEELIEQFPSLMSDD
jgi:NAD(P)-dependent dehydrogenase (short-subunit alcohol dehydrogenase family)